MNSLLFKPKQTYGLRIFVSSQTPKYSIIFDDALHKYFIRIYEDECWNYPTWPDAVDGFDTVELAAAWLNAYEWKGANCHHINKRYESENNITSVFIDAMDLLGFHESDIAVKGATIYEFQTVDSALHIRTMLYEDDPAVVYQVNGQPISKPATTNIGELICSIESVMDKHGYSIFSNHMLSDIKHRSNIFAAINTKNLSSDMVKVKSSNVWSYKLNVKDRHDKTGDLLVQFKNESGGPGDLYIYYEVPVLVYRRWQTALSKGHYFWVYIRNNYKYSKLTGDKRGKLHNAVN